MVWACHLALWQEFDPANATAFIRATSNAYHLHHQSIEAQNASVPSCASSCIQGKWTSTLFRPAVIAASATVRFELKELASSRIYAKPHKICIDWVVFFYSTTELLLCWTLCASAVLTCSWKISRKLIRKEGLVGKIVWRTRQVQSGCPISSQGSESSGRISCPIEEFWQLINSFLKGQRSPEGWEDGLLIDYAMTARESYKYACFRGDSPTYSNTISRTKSTQAKATYSSSSSFRCIKSVAFSAFV